MWEQCGGCRFCEFPYTAQIPVKSNNSYPIVDFNCEDDVWNVVDLLVEEVNTQNLEGNEFDLAKSVYAQLPFFSCMNIVKSEEAQKDIERYLYCQQFGISPYQGDYGEQPARWVKTSFIIRKALAKREREQIDAEHRRNNN